MKKIRQPQTFPLIDTGVIGGFELNVRSGNNFKFLFFFVLIERKSGSRFDARSNIEESVN